MNEEQMIMNSKNDKVQRRVKYVDLTKDFRKTSLKKKVWVW